MKEGCGGLTPFTNWSCLQNSGSKFPQIDLETRMLDGFSYVRSDRAGIGI
tara:strand:- start:303 stop:452 length:150 start_codon:yes stop_codon:yes gene_type:complete